jgi:hypothetical protein
MAKFVQMVPISLKDNVYLYIYGVDKEGQLVFRSSLLPKYEQRERFTVNEKGNVQLAVYNFPAFYLTPFANEDGTLTVDESL